MIIVIRSTNTNKSDISITNNTNNTHTSNDDTTSDITKDNSKIVIYTYRNRLR